jgi:hypothetical protein
MRLPAARCLVVAVLVIPTGVEPAAGQTPGTFARQAKRDIVPSRTLLAPSIISADELLDTNAAPAGHTRNVRPRQPVARHLLDDGCSRSATFRALVEQLNASDLVVHGDVRHARAKKAPAAEAAR